MRSASIVRNLLLKDMRWFTVLGIIYICIVIGRAVLFAKKDFEGISGNFSFMAILMVIIFIRSEAVCGFDAFLLAAPVTRKSWVDVRYAEVLLLWGVLQAFLIFGFAFGDRIGLPFRADLVVQYNNSGEAVMVSVPAVMDGLPSNLLADASVILLSAAVYLPILLGWDARRNVAVLVGVVGAGAVWAAKMFSHNSFVWDFRDGVIFTITAFAAFAVSYIISRRLVKRRDF